MSNVKEKKAAHTKLCRIVENLKNRYVDRDEMIDLLALALISKQHIFVLSPPGTAKTAIIREMAGWISAEFRGIQMRDDTKVEELFGMWDLRALEEGRYVRRWDRLAKADVVYINECFKGSPNALNALLGALHERQVDDETGYLDIPLHTAVLDSNELPRDEAELAAFFDRIMFRMKIDYIQDIDKTRRLLSGPTKSAGRKPSALSREDLNLLYQGASEVDLYPGYMNDIIAIKLRLLASDIIVSDRRWAESCGDKTANGDARVTPIRAAAFMRGDNIVDPQDLLVLSDCLWTDPSKKREVRQAVFEAVLPMKAKAQKLLDECTDALCAAEQSMDVTSARASIHTVTNYVREIQTIASNDGNPDSFAGMIDQARAIQARLYKIADGRGV